MAFRHADRRVAREMGLPFGPCDLARVAVTAPFLIGRLLVVMGATLVRRLRPLVDRYVARLVERRLATYGNPEFVTDSRTYTPAG
ncbi:hypothetical protein KO481_27300 [Nocardia sp. NEAU-G5]|uniref:Uncharacterized protein n=1 Tax=Nocardia albiluteola TaxID=2842303 RepID=A0ABS6B656_9NOCA|nr:hypothetical protein [Nocardia albiluteola]MBU3065221.1 hypothetical protein [Nocardia albiluteola]